MTRAPGNPFLIQDIPGVTPQIGRLAAMMNHARLTTLDAVQGLTPGQLDHQHDARRNSIGALLGHIATVETPSRWTVAPRRS
jgi:hypothetical protein